MFAKIKRKNYSPFSVTGVGGSVLFHSSSGVVQSLHRAISRGGSKLRSEAVSGRMAGCLGCSGSGGVIFSSYKVSSGELVFSMCRGLRTGGSLKKGRHCTGNLIMYSFTTKDGAAPSTLS